MFQTTSHTIGKFTLLTLTSSDGAHSLTCVPERGGLLTNIQLQGQELLDAYQTAEEIDFNRWGKSGLLYPFPNRLRDGQYEWEGATYQFPINDTANNNALHGFGMDRSLKISEQQFGENFGAITLVDRYRGEYYYYPWKFTLSVTYRLDREAGFTIQMMLRNDDVTALPIGLGWHPYFQLSTTVKDCALQLPSVQMVGVDHRMLPTGKRYDYEEFSTLREIGATVLDNCFALHRTTGQAEAIVEGDKGQMHYWQDARECPFLQVFTPPYGTSIALEPMTCNVDAFSNNEGLQALRPGASLQLTAGVSFDQRR